VKSYIKIDPLRERRRSATMRISRVRIKNYRNLKHVDVELGNIVKQIKGLVEVMIF
jgi:hypothetical protein